MKKLVTNDAWTGPDKKKHFAVGVGIVFAVGMVISPVAGVAVSIAAALGKEVYDSVTEKGTPSVQDFVVTVIGSGVGFLICEVFK